LSVKKVFDIFSFKVENILLPVYCMRVNPMPNLERAMVYKSNSLVEASYRLSVAEQRIVLACISQVPRGEPVTDEVMYSVSVHDIAELSETEGSNTYRDLQEATLRLKRREVRIEKEANGKAKRKNELICGWVQSVVYMEDEGRVCLRFNKDMLPYLTELSTQFTKYRLKAVAKMDSAYAVRLYELLAQWQGIGKREVSVEWLRDTFQLGDKYPAIKDLKKWVFDPAVAQINEHSDLTASYDQRKTGRNVTHLIFTFAPKEEAKPEPAKPQEAPADIHKSELFKRLRSHGIGAKLAAAWIQQDEARVRATVGYVEARAKQGQVKGSTAGYLRTLFEGGAEVGKSAFEAGLEAQAREAADTARHVEAENRNKAKADREAKDRAKAAVLALPPEARLALAAEYRQEAGAALSVSWDDGKGDFRDPLERIQFKVWLQKRLDA
jgi:plasmid replication initiation protein